ncbi:hypothetical protein H4R22_001710 [Coemansia sp. RSA 1290]|nr:hypothetical protein H4R22_001710 [Coemansia sp. RSA 1290]
MEWGIDVYCADLTSESYYVLEDPEVALDFDSRSYLPEFIRFEYGIESGNESGFKTRHECNPEDDRIPPKILEELKK